MFVLGLQGSPRKNGNTDYLLSTFIQAAAARGAQTHIVQVDQKNIVPCKEYSVCEKKGTCPIDDDMTHQIYPLLRRAEVIVAATPIFFYNTPAQLKALIDRSQTLWARKYRLHLEDPARKWRRGFLLALGATKGPRLFEGVDLTTKYFFDAVGARYIGSLTYRGIENRGDLKNHPSLSNDVQQALDDLLQPLLGRRKILFACRENACRSQMAAAFAMQLAGEKLEVMCGGSQPADQINPEMVEVMAERGIDMGFRTPQAFETVLAEIQPEVIISMGCREVCPAVPGVKIWDWDIPDPNGQSIEIMRDVRDEIEQKVTQFIREIS